MRPTSTLMPGSTKHGPRRRERHGLGAIVGSLPFLVVTSLLVAVLVKTALIQAFYIPSESMEPTLLPGDRVFVNKLHEETIEIARQDIVVFEHVTTDVVPTESLGQRLLRWLGEGLGVAKPRNEDYIKRVMGLPGETLEIHDRTVYVNGIAIEEPYLTRDARRCNDDFEPVTVPAGEFFVMGDNRCNSLDSRFGLGFV
ncbi:MAG: signal peptidase I, partial [Actinomycetota bacterium]